jgi:hypothetical protein
MGMINLLPAVTKQQLRAARTNSILFRYIIILGFAVAFLILACVATYLFLSNIKETNENSAKTSQSKISSTSNPGDSSIIARSILDRQVSYSSIITGIAASSPTGTVLDSLSLNSNTLDSPTTLQFYARSANSATTFKDNFKLPLFSNPSIQSTTSDPNGPTGYPTKIIVNVTINKGAVQ